MNSTIIVKDHSHPFDNDFLVLQDGEASPVWYLFMFYDATGVWAGWKCTFDALDLVQR